MPLSSCRRWPGILTMILLALVVTGCRSGPPRDTTGGRIDPYRTTDADHASSSASGAALWEYSDRVAESLVRDLSELDRIRTAPTRVVLELGNLRNRTNTPTGDFELIQHRIRGKIRKSRLIRDHFLIVDDPQRMDSEKQRIIGGGDDSTGTARYKAEETYVLMGDFFESRRGLTRRYYFEFKLTHLASRELIFNESYDLAQR